MGPTALFTELQNICLKYITKNVLEGSLEIFYQLLELNTVISKQMISTVKDFYSLTDQLRYYYIIHDTILGIAESELIFCIDYHAAGLIINSLLNIQIERPEPSATMKVIPYDKQALYEITKLFDNTLCEKLSQLININLAPAIPEIYLGKISDIRIPLRLERNPIILNEIQIKGVDAPFGYFLLHPTEETIKYILQSCKQSL